MYKKALTLTILIMLATSVAPVVAASSSDNGGRNIDINRIVVHPSGPDLNFTVYYDTNLFTQVFSMFFGAKTIQPSIASMFGNFTNVTVTRIDLDDHMAEVYASNQTYMSDNGLFVYDHDAMFPERIPKLEIRDTSEGPMIVENTDSLPFFTASP
jgi:hypothetical protein